LQFTDSEGGAITEHDGTRRIKTTVVGPNGATGFFERAYNPNSKELETTNGIFEITPARSTPAEHGAEAGSVPEMVAGKGAPTVQYVTLHQMRKLSVPLGDGSVSAGVEKVHLSDIQNIETIVNLHYLKTTLGGDLSDLVAYTASVK